VSTVAPTGAAAPIDTPVGDGVRRGAMPAQLNPALDEHTLGVLEYKRAVAGVKSRGRLVRRALMWADLAALSLAFALSQVLYQPAVSDFNHLGTAMEYATFFATLPLWLLAAKLYGLYDRDESRANHSTADDIVGVFHLVTIVAWLLLAGAYMTQVASPAFTKVIIFWMLAIPIVTLARVGARALCRCSRAYIQNTVVVGAGDVGQLIARKILKHPEYGINLVGFVDDQPKEQVAGLEHLTLLGAPEQLPAVVRALDVQRVIVAFSNDPFERTVGLVRSLNDSEVQVDIVPRLFDLVSPSAEIHSLEGIPLLGIPSFRLSRSTRLVKRTMDVLLVGVGLVLLAPLLGLIALLIKLDTPGPVFFRQLRIGGDGKPFRILKFRTMVADAEERKAAVQHLNKHLLPGGDPRMFKISGDPRITRVGRFLRRYSLDEFPQLINVLRDEMSLVGPRPLIPDEHSHVDDWARKRMNLKPGITGLWQVLGRSDIPFEEMVKLDYLYVTNWSLWQDFRLLLRTIPLVAMGKGGSY